MQAYQPTMPDVLLALSAFIRQRPRIDPNDYFHDWRDVDGRRAYTADARKVQRDRQDAFELWHYVQTLPVTAGDMIEASRGRRLSLEPTETGVKVDYCTGQYWPTEYRAAAAQLLANTIWNAWRAKNITAENIRAKARDEFGRGIASRYF